MLICNVDDIIIAPKRGSVLVSVCVCTPMVCMALTTAETFCASSQDSSAGVRERSTLYPTHARLLATQY